MFEYISFRSADVFLVGTNADVFLYRY